MEEQPEPTHPPHTPKPQNPKHLALLERLSKPHTTTSTTCPPTSSSSSIESTSTFLARFADSKRLIESQLATTPPNTATDLKSHIEKISYSIEQIEKLVAENSYYLPAYDLRSSLKTVSELKQALENLSSQLNPRRKFSFRNKPVKRDPVLMPVVDDFRDSESGAVGVNDRGGEERVVGKSSGESELGVRVGIRDRRGEVVRRSFRGCGETGEFTLSRLEGCEVRLEGCVRTLFIDKLRDCKVYGGPVMGSVLVEDVEGCVFVLASHQVRIHEARRCDFYLRVRSRPIIEDSFGVRFAQYCLRYDGIEDDLREVGLDEETGNWANVDDFKWLRAVQSPNWSFVPEDERIAVVDISSSKGEEDVGNTV